MLRWCPVEAPGPYSGLATSTAIALPSPLPLLPWAQWHQAHWTALKLRCCTAQTLVRADASIFIVCFVSCPNFSSFPPNLLAKFFFPSIISLLTARLPVLACQIGCVLLLNGALFPSALSLRSGLADAVAISPHSESRFRVSVLKHNQTIPSPFALVFLHTFLPPSTTSLASRERKRRNDCDNNHLSHLSFHFSSESSTEFLPYERYEGLCSLLGHAPNPSPGTKLASNRDESAHARSDPIQPNSLPLSLFLSYTHTHTYAYLPYRHRRAILLHLLDPPLLSLSLSLLHLHASGAILDTSNPIKHHLNHPRQRGRPSWKGYSTLVPSHGCTAWPYLTSTSIPKVILTAIQDERGQLQHPQRQ